MTYIIFIILIIAIIVLYAELRILNNKVSLLQDLVTGNFIQPKPILSNDAMSEEELKAFKEEDAKAAQAFMNMTAELNAFMTGREDVTYAEQQQ